MACLTFVHFSTTTRNGVHQVLGHVEFSWWLDTEEISLESLAISEYCPDVIWTTYLLDPFGLAFDIGQTYCGEFSGIVPYPSIQVFWSQCYAL